MSKMAVFFAEGYEEIEALTVVDICRRCNIEVETVSVTEEKSVMGSHGILVTMDQVISKADFASYDMLILPGGLKGTQGLEACEPLKQQIMAFYEAGKYIGAICAAPSIFGHMGLLKGRNACSYPDFESHLEGASVTAGPVEISDHVVTSRGMGTSIDFALAVAGLFVGKDAAQNMARKIVYRQ